MTDPTPPQGRPEPAPPPVPGPHTGMNPVVPAPSGPPTGTFPVVSGPPTGTFPVVPGPPTGTIPVVPPAQRPRGTTALALTLSMLGTVLLVVIAGVIWFGTTGGPAGQRGGFNGPIAYPEGLGEALGHTVEFAGDAAYFRSTSAEGDVWITAVDVNTGAEKWSLDEGLDGGGNGVSTPIVYPGRDAVLVTMAYGSSDEENYLIDADSGEVSTLTASQGAPIYHRMVGGMPVRSGVGDGGIEVLDATGDKLWENEDASGSANSVVAVSGPDDLAVRTEPGNPINAESLLTVDDDGTVKTHEPRSGKVLTEEEEALEPGTSVLLAFDDVLYANSTSDDRDIITAYDMKDGYTEIDSWESETGQSFTRARPCGGKRICLDGYYPGDASRPGSAVIDRDDGIVWTAPESFGSMFSYPSFAGDTMVVAYYTDYYELNQAETQVYDEDFEEIGDPVPGWFYAVDDKTFASVAQPEETAERSEVYDAEISIIDGDDGRVSRLDSYPTYPGCSIGGAVLACPTKAGYRLWDYR